MMETYGSSNKDTGPTFIKTKPAAGSSDTTFSAWLDVVRIHQPSEDVYYANNPYPWHVAVALLPWGPVVPEPPSSTTTTTTTSSLSSSSTSRVGALCYFEVQVGVAKTGWNIWDDHTDWAIGIVPVSQAGVVCATRTALGSHDQGTIAVSYIRDKKHNHTLKAMPSDRSLGLSITPGTVVGIGLDAIKQCLFVTVNGKYRGVTASKQVLRDASKAGLVDEKKDGGTMDLVKAFYPAIAVSSRNLRMKVNIGQEGFVFDAVRYALYGPPGGSGSKGEKTKGGGGGRKQGAAAGAAVKDDEGPSMVGGEASGGSRKRKAAPVKKEEEEGKGARGSSTSRKRSRK